MKIHIRLPWLVVALILAAVLSAASFDYSLSIQQSRQLRDTFTRDELITTQLLVASLEDAISINDWVKISTDLPQFQRATLSDRILLVNKNGGVIIDTKGSGAPVPPELVQDAFQIGAGTYWDQRTDVLSIAVLFRIPNDKEAAVLMRQVDKRAEMTQSRINQQAGLMINILVTTTIGLLILTVIWFWVLKPLEKMQRAAQKMAGGNLSLRHESGRVVELNDLSRSVNQMLDSMEDQRSEMEGLNRKLERTVAENAQAIERASRDLANRAASFEAVNRIINAASSSTNVHELGQVAFEQIRLAMHADYGWIALDGRLLYAVLPEEDNPELEKMLGQVIKNPDVRLLVPDWLSPDLPQELEKRSRSLLEMDIRSTASLSIRAGKKPIGRIDLASKQPNFWTEPDFALMEIISQQLGVAVERLQVFEESLENARLMTRLAELAGLLNRPLSLNEVAATIGRGMADLSGAPRVAVFERSEGDGLTMLWENNLSRRLVRSLTSRSRNDSSFFLPVHPVVTHVADVSALSEEKAEWWQMAGGGIRAYSSWPLVFEGQSNAVVVCFHDRPASYNRIQTEVLEAFSRQAAIALRNSRLLTSEREQRILAEALRDVTSVLTSTLDRDEVIELILTNLNRVVEHEAANVMLLEGNDLRIVRSRGQPLLGVELREWTYPLSMFKILETVYHTGRAVAVPDTDREPRWLRRPESSWVKSYATAPIRSRGKVIGFVNVSSKQPGFYTQMHAGLLQAFADQSSVAMDNATLFKRTSDIAAESNTLLRVLEPLFTAGGDLATVSEQITQAVVQEFEAVNCGLALVDKERGRAFIYKEAGELHFGEQYLALNGPGLTVAAIQSGEIIYAPDVRLDSRYYSGNADIRSELVIPLNAAGEMVGALDLESSRLDAFSEKSRRMLAAFAERAAWVVANALLFESTRKGVHQMTLLNEITQVALSGGEHIAVLREVVWRVAELLHADGCYMTAWEEATQQTIPLIAFGLNADVYTDDIPEPGEKNLTFTVMHSLQPVIVEDVFESSLVPRQVADTFPVRSLLAVPLQVNGSKLGALLVGFNLPYRFVPSEIVLMQQAAGQIALILARNNALQDAQKRAEESERLRQASAALTTTLDVQQVANLIIEHMGTLVAYDMAAVFITLPDELKPVACRNGLASNELLDIALPIDDPLYADIAREKLPVFLKDAKKDPRFANWSAIYDVRSAVGLPMLAGNQVVGIICLGRGDVKEFSSAELLAAQVFANQAGVAMQNAVLHAYQQQLAITDPLTGLYNRRGFFELARHELERSRRFNRPLSMMLLDIDHFKNVNDQYGHPAGDDVLRELARRFHGVMRESDLVCRYGGEEFCFLLPESDTTGLLGAAERLLTDIRSQPFHSEDLQIHITVSIGITSLKAQQSTLEDLIEQADQALYRAKQAGRDRVESWQ
jgi:diguanylate cyclase (GGDEF)-like protein